MGVWANHQVRSLGKELTCPLCRTDWGEFSWRPPPPKRKPRESAADGRPADVHHGSKCGACKRGPIAGKRYRCILCADYDLCEACFASGAHVQHPFAVKDTPGSMPAAAERPGMMPTCTGLAAAAATSAGGAAAAAAAAFATSSLPAAAAPAGATRRGTAESEEEEAQAASGSGGSSGGVGRAVFGDGVGSSSAAASASGTPPRPVRSGARLARGSPMPAGQRLATQHAPSAAPLLMSVAGAGLGAGGAPGGGGGTGSVLPPHRLQIDDDLMAVLEGRGALGLRAAASGLQLTGHQLTATAAASGEPAAPLTATGLFLGSGGSGPPAGGAAPLQHTPGRRSGSGSGARPPPSRPTRTPSAPPLAPSQQREALRGLQLTGQTVLQPSASLGAAVAGDDEDVASIGNAHPMALPSAAGPAAGSRQQPALAIGPSPPLRHRSLSAPSMPARPTHPTAAKLGVPAAAHLGPLAATGLSLTGSALAGGSSSSSQPEGGGSSHSDGVRGGHQHHRHAHRYKGLAAGGGRGGGALIPGDSPGEFLHVSTLSRGGGGLAGGMAPRAASGKPPSPRAAAAEAAIRRAEEAAAAAAAAAAAQEEAALVQQGGSDVVGEPEPEARLPDGFERAFSNPVFNRPYSQDCSSSSLALA